MSSPPPSVGSAELLEDSMPKKYSRRARRGANRAARKAESGLSRPPPAPRPQRRLPETGIPVPERVSTRTVLTPERRNVPGMVDYDVGTAWPVNNRPKFATDAAGFADLIDASYSTLRASNSKLTNDLPFPLYSYYCWQMFWMRAMYTQVKNTYYGSANTDRLLRVLDTVEAWLPMELYQWLTGLGNTTTPAGDVLQLYVQAIPSDANARLPLSFGRYDANSAWLYATLPAPATLVGFIQETIANDTDPNPIENAPWLPSFAPAAVAGHTWMATRNLLGWHRRRISTKRGLATMLDLGWTANASPSDVFGPWATSPKTMNYVGQVLQQLSNKHQMVQFRNTTEVGYVDQLPHLTTSGNMTEALLQKVTVDSEVQWWSQFLCDPQVISTSFVEAYRFERAQSDDQQTSAAYPFLYEENATHTIVPLPWATDINRSFTSYDAPAYINNRSFRGSNTERGVVVSNVSRHFVVAGPKRDPT